jgi:hypothetical protein
VTEAERHDRSIPRVLSEKATLEWVAYRGPPLELSRLDNPLRELDNLLQRYETPPQDERQINEGYVSGRRDLLVLHQLDYFMKAAAGDELLAALKADKLVYFTRPADDPFAELKRGHSSSWAGFQHWSDVAKPSRFVLSRIALDDRRPVDRVFFFDEAQAHRLWPAGKRLVLPDEFMKRFVEGYASSHPEMGADALYRAFNELLPPELQGLIPRDRFFRDVVRKPKGKPKK